ncbi:MAG: RNA polymerase sigma factor [Candidatus Latescibacteria bacterium]|nr:RNA polymerase sigma factor [Candidatus Latescibacterota bacterium]
MTVADLYEAFEEKLHRFAASLTRDSHAADDLVQETFIRAMAHLELLGQLNDPQRSAYLYRVLKNLFIDQQLTRQREQALVERLTLETPSASHPTTEEVMSPSLFELIPDRYRELLEKRYVLGMTGEEIARELGIPAATVRSRLHLAIKQLRAHKTRYL